MDAQDRVWPYLAIVFCLLMLSLIAPHYWQWRHRGGEITWAVIVGDVTDGSRYIPDAPVPRHPGIEDQHRVNSPGVAMGDLEIVADFASNNNGDTSTGNAQSEATTTLWLNGPLDQADEFSSHLSVQGPILLPPRLNPPESLQLRPQSISIARRQSVAQPASGAADSRADQRLKKSYQQLLAASEPQVETDADWETPWQFTGEAAVVEFSPLVANQVRANSDRVSTEELMPPQIDVQNAHRVPRRVAILFSRGPRRFQSVDHSAWPRPSRLIAQLREVDGNPISESWAEEVVDALQHLHYVRSLDSPAASDALTTLTRLSHRADTLAPTIQPEAAQRELREVAATLKRRMQVWQQVHLAAQPSRKFHQVSFRKVTDIRPAITAAIASIPGTKAPPAWRHFLRLDDIEYALSQGPLGPWEQAELARQTLRRMNSPRLDYRQKQLLAGDTFVELAAQLKTWATEPVDSTEVLHTIEKFEQSGQPSEARQVAEIADRYRWSVQPIATRISRSIDDSYRNANLRVAVTGTLLNEMLEQPEDQTAPVAEQILEAWVEGQRHTTTSTSIRLIPDDDQWRLGFEAKGTTYSDTTSYAGRATFQSEGWGEFSARKLIVVEADRVRLWKAEVDASHHSQVYAVGTSLDGLPLVNQIARNRAMNEYEGRRCAAQQIVEARIRQRVQESVDAQVQAPIKELQEDFGEELFKPLDRLGIQPTTVGLETTSQRIVGKYRLAAHNELAATTARPWAPRQCRASAQIHESLINNLIAGMRFDGRTMTAHQLRSEVWTALGREAPQADEDDSRDLVFQFAEQDAVVIRLHENRLELTARFAEVRHEGRTWTDLEVSTDYQPDTSTQLASLSREGSTRIHGKRLGLRDQVRVRGIFGATFNRFEQFDLIPQELIEEVLPPHLALTQYVIVDGWIGLAWGPKDQAEVVADLQPHWLSR